MALDLNLCFVLCMVRINGKEFIWRAFLGVRLHFFVDSGLTLPQNFRPVEFERLGGTTK